MTNVHNIIQKYIKKYNIKKIETKGDCYICITGVQECEKYNKKNQMTRLMNFSRDIISKLKTIKNPETSIRIGINYGNITLSYIENDDMIPLKTIYGDDVNIAARMEQTSLPNTIQLAKKAAEKYTEENNLKLSYDNIKNVNYKNLNNFKTFLYDENLKLI
jgi:guanylate cyclase